VATTRHGRHAEVVATEHHGRHHEISKQAASEKVVAHAPKTRYAYPMSIFMLKPPEFERSALPSDVSSDISRAFEEGHADDYAARSLVRAGLVQYHPLHGGIFWRRESVKYIIMHSTETGIPMGAPRVIDSWGSAGRRHAGAQYVVDRDGTIYQSVDPDLATVHVNVFKTLPGINNDNSIGIEMCHAGHQDYTPQQRQSVIRLVAYLQDRYKVVDENVITHRYAQRGDHTDPVNFDWDQFIADKDRFRTKAIAYKLNRIKQDASTWEPVKPTVETTTYVQQHTTTTKPGAHPATVTTTTTTTSSTTEAAGSDLLRGPIEMDPGAIQTFSTPEVPAQQPTPAPNVLRFTPQPIAPTLKPAPAPQPTLLPVPPAAPAPSPTPAQQQPDDDVQMFVH
jgi:hypothetical protein